MFNPHIHQQQQQQQQQFHQHLRQIRQLFQQQPPPPPPQPPPGHHVAHHHQTPRPIPVPPQTAPPPRMVNLCQATQTTIIAPNPMLQGAILMQQMQGNMRGFGMGGQQFRQFFTGGTRSSLLGPVPMGMAIKSPIMGFPTARPFHPHARFYNNTTTTSASSSSTICTTDTAARQPDRKRDIEQMAGGGTDDQTAAASSTNEEDRTQTDGALGGADGPTHVAEEQLEEPVAKKLRTEGSERPCEPCGVETAAHDEGLSSVHNWKAEDTQSEDGQDGGSTEAPGGVEALKGAKTNEVDSCLSALSPSGRLSEDDQQVNLPAEETLQGAALASTETQEEEEEEEESVAESSNKFYCYLCSITCHNQQNFRSHMNSISHQQRMMEIQHMSNACLVTLLPRVQESLQGASKDGEKKDMKRWCSTCQVYFTSSITEHHRTEEHKLASRTDLSSCAVCKKHFKSSQSFLEHLQSQEHRQKLQEKGCEALAKLTDLDTDGFSLEEEGGGEVEEREENLSDTGDKQDGWSSPNEVTLNNITSDEQYDPDTVYGSSFLVPVAGFICRLCNKFYHLESSALHTHCKSLKHFNNLKTYQALASQKGEAVESFRESLGDPDSLRPQTETSTDCSDESWLSNDPGLSTNLNSRQPIITLTRLKMTNQQQENKAEPDPTSQDFTTVSATSTGNTNKDFSLHQQEEEDPSQTSLAQESPAELPAGSRQGADSEPSAVAEETNEDEEEKEAPAGPEKKNGTGKAKTKRRSGRVSNRR